MGEKGGRINKEFCFGLKRRSEKPIKRENHYSQYDYDGNILQIV